MDDKITDLPDGVYMFRIDCVFDDGRELVFCLDVCEGEYKDFLS